MQKILKVAIYRRVSTDEQVRDGDSLDAQLKTLMKYIEMFPNYELIGDYCDDGISGQKTKRPAYLRLIEDVKMKKVDLIIFTKLDRWFRNLTEYLNTQKILEKNGVSWNAVLESHDTSTAAGEAVVNILMSVAQMEAKQTGERISFVFDNKIKKGEAISGTVPYGYKIKDKHFVVDEEKRDHVVQTFNTFLQCGSMRATMNQMNRTLFSCNIDRIKKILTNPIYIGIYHRKNRFNDNFCEPIISKEIFDKVQKMIATNIKTYNYNEGAVPYTYIFRGLLYCPECGSKMTSSKYKYKNGYKYYYRCPKHRNNHCDYKKVIYENVLEDFLVNTIADELSGRIDVLKEYSINKIDQNKNAVDRLNRRLVKLKELYLDDLIKKADYIDEYNSITDELDKLEAVHDTHEEINKLKNIKAELEKGFSTFYYDFTNEEKRSFWYAIIYRIDIIDQKHFILTFA